MLTRFRFVMVYLLQIDLQGVQIPRHHVPEGGGRSQIQNIVLPDEIPHLLKQAVVDLTLLGQLLGVADDQLVVVAEQLARLVRGDAVDLLA